MLDRLTDKVGGIPVWVWGVIFGGLVVVWMWVSRRGSSGDSPASGAANISSEEAADLNAALQGLSSGSNPLTSGGSPDAAEPGETRSNDWWLNQSLMFLVGQGSSPLAVQRALQKYLSGQTLTQAESLLVNRAVTKFGLPPQGVSDIPSVEPKSTTPTTPTPTTPKPPTPKPSVPKPSDPTSKRTFFTINPGDGRIYRLQNNGTKTPISQSAWSAFRLTSKGRGVKVIAYTGAQAETARRAGTNNMITSASQVDPS